MNCADTSVLVPALAEWHVRHRQANDVLVGPVVSVGHCVVEAFSVLTRLPEPLRMSAAIASSSVAGLVEQVIVLGADDVLGAPQRLARAGIAGGATYDGLIALTAAHHGATIITLDTRAIPTYRACGAAYQLIS